MESDKVAEVIITMATERGPEKTICPSEVARAMFDQDWRKHMSLVRDTAIALQQQGKVSITQKGAAVNVQHIKGPIRIKIV